MAISLINSLTAVWSSGTYTTSPIDTTGANFIAIAADSLVSGPFTGISDSEGNVWNNLPWIYNGANSNSTIYYAFQVVTSASHTFTFTTGTLDNDVVVGAFSVVGSTEDQTGTSFESSGFSHTIQTATITPSQNNSLVLTSVGGGQGPWTIPSPWTIIGQGSDGSLAFGYLVQNQALPVNVIWTQGGNTFLASYIIDFGPLFQTQASLPLLGQACL